uniref:ferroxidase n=1 Tax=Electrophorus electricus TaxID=8005 RepID=A0A4W4EHW2_ELEEL
MRLHSWPWASSALPLLLYLAHCVAAVERHYYIAAVNINWDYTANGNQRHGSTYKKTVYRAYDEGFKHAKTHPSWLGLLGPPLHGQEGETIVVTFKNMADRPCSIHPHGITYGKQSEGSLYFDNTSEFEKEDDVISPGNEHTYYWDVTPEVAPKATDPHCITYMYSSHYDIIKDYNTGLIGTLLICKKDSLDDSGKQHNFHQEFMLLFGVFDENNGWYSKGGPPLDENVKYTINGYTNGSIPGLSVCAHSEVNWNLLGMSSEQELFSVHFNGQVLQRGGHKVSSVGLISGTATSAEMIAVHPGRWLLSSFISKHLEFGMHGFLTVNKCKEFTAPKRRITIVQSRESQEWTYYIAAEEEVWDYAPNLPENVDKHFRAAFLKQSAERIGKKYKKALFTQYKDALFKERAEHKQRKKELGILGPVIRAQIRDIIKIVFKNKASRPYSIYPHGLTIDKAAEGANYPEGGDHAVQPGETYTYVWRVVEEDEPLERDARCLTRMYHSAVNTPKDIASGLIGPLLICKSQSLNTKNVQLRADKEQHATFAIFDENKSWYLAENINTYCEEPAKVKPDDPEFYKSNIMHTINGYVYESGQVLGFCNGEIVTWHVSSVGNQDDIQTATFYGHTFELNNREEDILSLFPMTGETITMGMANDGIWLLASLNTHETAKGLRVKFKDVECFRDYVKAEYELKREREKQLNNKIRTVEIDVYTDMYADVLGLRTLHNTENSTDDLEELDLSFLDHDDGLVHRDSGPSLTAKIPNITHLGVKYPEVKFDSDDKNLTSMVVQNTSTEETLRNNSIMHDPISMNSSTNFSNTWFLQDNDRNITSVDSHNRSPVAMSLLSSHTSEGDGENVTEIKTHTKELSGMISAVDEEDDDRSRGIFSYSVPALNSPLNIAEDQDMEDIVLLEGSEPLENITYLHLNEHNIVTTALPINTTPEQLSVTTLNIMNEEVQVLNTTKMNSTLLSKMVRKLNTTQVDTEHSSKEVQELNSTQLDTEFSNNDVQEFNYTQTDLELASEDLHGFIIMEVDSELSNKEVQELSSTQLDSKLSNKDVQKCNNTQDSNVDEEVQEFSSTKVDSKSSSKEVQELNSTQADLEVSSEELQEFIIMEVALNFSKKEVQELNSTQLDFSNKDVQEFNNTKKINISSEEVQEFNITQEDTELSSQNVTSSFLETFTDNAQNEKLKPNVSKLWNCSDEFNSESLENTSFPCIFNLSSQGRISNGTLKNESAFAGKEDHITDTLLPSGSSEKGMPDTEELSKEEVVIYVQDHNNTEVIFTTPLDQQSENWTYEGKHQLVPMEMPEDISKYIIDKPLTELNGTSSAKEDKNKIVLKRLMPMKGYGLKTKKKKDYKPQPQSAVSPRYFSPRGFGPSELALQGTRSKSSEEDMQGKSIIIGVPRRDFSDYEIYVTDQKQNMEDIPDENEDYEYVEYKDPYKKQIDLQNTVIDDGSKYSLKITGTKARSYFITAEEVDWDYAGYGQRTDHYKRFLTCCTKPTLFKKVAFRAYLDSSFTTPHIRGELDEHLGILGPVIKAEIDETIYIVFRNLASRPYSLHVNGVSYGKNMEGLKYDDQSPYWYKQDDAIEPNATFIYMWTVNAKVGPQQDESDCRIWAYYSGVNPERDIHSGLIGPLLVCRKGTLNTNPVDTQDFMLLFMTFDENKSWYYEKNREILEKTNRKAVMDPEFNNNIKFSAINGIIYSLKGLRMYSNHLIKWHLINMGSPKDLHSIHFHGQTFLNKNMYDHRQAVYPLLPGGFATLEMWPSKPGLWLLESEVGLSQQRGMQTLFLVLDNVCDHSLGLNSGTVKDSQITASDYRSYWLPSLARLHNTGKYNAWSTTKSEGWIQVDFQRPVVISKVATQGAKQLFTSHFVQNYTVSYSTDRKSAVLFTFEGNREAHEVKENIFFPPIIGRYVRLHPSHSYNYPTIRMDFYGCELDGCSVPLGMQSGLITDQQITASSVATNWYSGPWHSWYGRLDKQGTANAWQSKSNDMQPWLQIELKVVKKITGIVTQGAKTLGTEMFVTSYVLEYSDDGIIWTKYTDDEDYEQKTFSGNSDNISHVKNYIYPPIFSKYIRIIPKKWQNAVTMRIELLGCDFE